MTHRHITFALTALALTTLASAHPPDEHGVHTDGHTHAHADLRAWTNAKTGEVVRGAFLAMRSNIVSIERENGDVVTFAFADLSAADQNEAREHAAQAQQLNTAQPAAVPAGAPSQAAAFAPFAPYVTTRWDDTWLYIESDGLPHTPAAHPMMIGIRSWQRQVPLPQQYKGNNAWRIPLTPQLADEPISGATHLRRGAIALAVNGVPIFNALNNRGDDAFKAGELDQYGGHSGRADDYHYHIAPLALQKVVGHDKPIAFALDGFPIFGLFDPSAKSGDKTCPLGGVDPLDKLNGHTAADGSYHYHASLDYPYINGGIRGKVQVVNDQIEPQPRTTNVRESGTPLRGATITNLVETADNAWALTYVLGGKQARWNYRIEGEPGTPDAKYIFEFIDTDGAATTQTYTVRNRAREPRPNAEGGNPDRPDNQRPRKNRDNPQDTQPDNKPQGPDPNQPRKPWLAAHAAEIDTDNDGTLTLDEATKQANTAFDGFNRNNDDRLTPEEYDGARGAQNVRAPMAGFIQLHAKELDADADANITRTELITTLTRMFAKSDRDNDNALSPAELNASPQERGQPDQDRPQRGGQRRNQQREGDAEKRSLIDRMTEFKTEVPAHDLDIVLAQPGATTMTASVMRAAEGDIEASIEWNKGTDISPALAKKTSLQTVHHNQPVSFALTDLTPGTTHAYRVRWRTLAEKPAKPATWQYTPVATFRTQPKPATPFTFTIIADSHLDANVTPAAYEQTLANIRADKPDLHIDLGDTFMVDKRRTHTDAYPQYLAQRHYFSLTGAPVLMVLGNHDGEAGHAMSGPNSIAAWSYAQRTMFFPPPNPTTKHTIFTGRTDMQPSGAANYYECTWGDAQFIVLDPFWFTMSRPRGGPGAGDTANTDDNWARTLGKEQYDWLTRTLETSTSKYIFVFTHHLVGGLGKATRGGVEASTFFEWGGHNADGSDGFAQRRKDWKLPIHDLLTKYKVSAVFHGHDHLYVRNQRDGLIYQCVPQPGNIAGGTRSAAEYGYTAGDIAGSPGHIRVRITADTAAVEFIRSAVADAPRRKNADADARDQANGTIVESYTIAPRR